MEEKDKVKAKLRGAPTWAHVFALKADLGWIFGQYPRSKGGKYEDMDQAS